MEKKLSKGGLKCIKVAPSAGVYMNITIIAT